MQYNNLNSSKNKNKLVVLFFIFHSNESTHKSYFHIKIQQPTTTMSYRTDENTIKTLSKSMIGSPPGLDFRFTDYERFKAKFGITTELCALLWNKMVKTLDLGPSNKGFSRLSPVHLLYGLFFLKVYPTSRQSIGSLGVSVGQHQFSNYAKFMIRNIAALKNDVVRQ